jgi:NADH:ubiquinone oxidoreductase subunit 5 (subunit L)/multisubunit Na+/H+ antiporter MnhA subunit
MTRPLVVLALCVIALSVVLTPAWPWLHDYLVGDRPHFDLAQLVPPMLLVSLVLVAAGIGLGIFIYRRAEDIDPLQKAQPLLFRFLENKMWLDELYEHSVIALGRTAARISDWMDRYVWDGVVLIVGKLGQLAGIVSKGFDEHAINNGVDEGVAGAQGLGRFISGRHTGHVQGYLGVLAIGALTLLIIYAWLA